METYTKWVLRAADISMVSRASGAFRQMQRVASGNAPAVLLSNDGRTSYVQVRGRRGPTMR